MWFLSTFVLACCVAIWLYGKWVRVSTYWARRNVPYAPPSPIFGNLPIRLKKNISVWMREMYKDFKTPYVGIWLFWRPALVINSPEIARRVLVKDADHFRDRFVSPGKTDPIGGLNIFTVKEPIWSTVRRRLTPVFTTAKLKVLQDMVRTKAKDLVTRIKMEMKENKKIDMRTVYTDYGTDIIGTAAFGVECNALLTKNSVMRNITMDWQTYSPLRLIGHSIIFFFPELVDLFRFSFFPKATTRYFKRVFEAVVEKRGGYNRKMTENKDLLDYLLNMRQDAALEKEVISEDLLVAQAAIFVLGGFETTSATLTFMCYELAHSPKTQEKLYREVLGIKQKLGDEDFNMDVLSDAVYLHGVFKETLRKYPPMAWLDRIAAKDYQIDENLTIPAGTPVYVNAVGTQVNPQYFPEPEKFKPERFLPENENLTPFTYMPFGEGPRSCIGKRFAYLINRFAMANLMLNFELRPWPNSPAPNDSKLEENSLFLLPGEVLSVQFIPRN